MNVQETTEIRELTATELDHVSGGETFQEWLVDYLLNTLTLAIMRSGCGGGGCTGY